MFERILKLLYSGAKEVPVPGIQKQAIGALGLLLDRFIPAVDVEVSMHIGVGGSVVGKKRDDLPSLPEELKQQIVSFIREALCPVLFEACTAPWIDLLDVESKSVGGEGSSLPQLCSPLFHLQVFALTGFSRGCKMPAAAGDPRHPWL